MQVHYRRHAPSGLVLPLLTIFCIVLSVVAGFVPISHRCVARRYATKAVAALPPEQGVPLLVGLAAYPTLLIYKNTIGSSLGDPIGSGRVDKAMEGETFAEVGSIGRALKWSKLIDVPPAPYVRICVGQDCTKDGSPETWGMVREAAPAGVSVVPVNCLGPCGTGPCAQSYAAEVDLGRRCPIKLSDDDGFYDDDLPPPEPAVLPSGIVKPRVAGGRKRRTNAFISTEVKSPADARVLFRGMGYSDSELYGGRGYRVADDFEVTSTRRGPLDLNRLDNILIQRIGYAALFTLLSSRFQLDGGADIAVADALPPVPVWLVALGFFALTQIISVDPDANTYRPCKDDLKRPIPHINE